MTALCFDQADRPYRPLQSVLPRVSRAGSVVGATGRRSSDAVQASSTPRPTAWSSSMQKNLSSARKNFCADTEDFRSRQVSALQRRILDTGITAKMLARAIGRHAQTVLNWRNGDTIMSCADARVVDGFFRRNGDFDFLTDLFGDTTARRREQAEALERRARELRGGSLEDELDRMERLLARIIEEKRGRAAAE